MHERVGPYRSELATCLLDRFHYDIVYTVIAKSVSGHDYQSFG